MADRLDRVLLVVLLATGLLLGVWATFFPASFYADFPGGGRAWVAADGPFNEHLVRDVGAGYLGMAVLALGALLRPVRELVLTAGVAFFVFGAPHLVYHVRHADIYDTSDKIGSIGGIALTTVIALVLAIRSGRRMVSRSEVPASLT
jgi:hypothetical protein